MLIVILQAVHAYVISEFMEGDFSIASGWTDSNGASITSQWSCTESKTGPFFGLLTKNVQKQYSSLQPHYEIVISIDILYTGYWNSANNYVKIEVDGTEVWKRDNIKTSEFTSPENVCQQNILSGLTQMNSMQRVTVKILHNQPSMNFALKGQFQCTLLLALLQCERLAIKNLVMHFKPCHSSCLTCSGPTQTDCLSCPSGALTGGACKCVNLLTHNHQCVASCPTYFYSSSGACVKGCDAHCKTCEANQCSLCDPPQYFRFHEDCVQDCPTDSRKSGRDCKDLSENSKYGSQYIARYFHSFDQDILEISSKFLFLDYQQSNSYYFGALHSYFGQIAMLGGFGVWGDGKFRISFNSLAPHNKVRLYCTLYMFDNWSSQSFLIFVDGVQTFQRQASTQSQDQNTFWRNTKDQQYDVELDTTHINAELTIEFRTSLSRSSFQASLGISDLFILIDYCAENCSECQADGCKTCNSGYMVDGKECTQCGPSLHRKADCTCMSGYYERNKAECGTCAINCSSCFDANKCIECSQGLKFINPPLCKDCIQGYYYYEHSCVQCPLGCQSCMNDQKCLQCKNDYYLNEYGICINCLHSSIVACTSCERAILEIYLSDDLRKIHILFQNSLQLEKDYFCNYYFEQDTLAVLGANPECQLSEKTLTIELGQNHEVKIGTLIEFRTSKELIFVDCQYKILNWLNNQVQYPKQILSPKIVLEDSAVTIIKQMTQEKSPKVKIVCFQNFGGISPVNMRWVTQEQGKYLDLLRDLNQQIASNPALKIFQFQYYPVGTVQLQLVYENFIGTSMHTALTVNFSEADGLFAYIIQNKFEIERGEQIEIYVMPLIVKNGAIQNDQISEVELKVKMTSPLLSSEMELEKTQIYTNQYRELSYSTQNLADGLYEFQFMLVYTSYLYQLTKYVAIQKPMPKISILGGSRQAGYNQPLRLEAVIQGNQEPENQIRWSCQNLTNSQSCTFQDERSLSFTVEPVQTMMPKTFTPYQAIQFTAALTLRSQQSTVQSSIIIFMVEEDIPPLTLIYKNIDEEFPINLYDRIQLQYEYNNSQSDPDNLIYVGAFYQNFELLMIQTFKYLEISFQLWDFKLDLNESLPLDSKYTIYSMDYMMPSSFSETIDINQPPLACIVSAAAVQGKSLSDEFNFTVGSCVDLHYPLQFRFVLYKDQHDLAVDYNLGFVTQGFVLQEYSQNAQFRNFLAGTPNSSLLVMVMDAKKGISNFTLALNISESENQSEEYDRLLTLAQEKLDGQKIYYSKLILFDMKIHNNFQAHRQILQRILIMHDQLKSNPQVKQAYTQTLSEASTQISIFENFEEGFELTQLDEIIANLKQINQEMVVWIKSIQNSITSKYSLELLMRNERIIANARMISNLNSQQANKRSRQYRGLQEAQADANFQDKYLEAISELKTAITSQQIVNGEETLIATENFEITTGKYTAQQLLLQRNINTPEIKQVEFKLVKLLSNPLTNQTIDNEATFVSKAPIYNLTLINLETGSQIQNLNQSYTYNFTLEVTENKTLNNLQCVSQVSATKWSSLKCQTKQSKSSVICECTTLTPTTIAQAAQQLASQFFNIFSLQTLERIKSYNYVQDVFIYILIIETIIYFWFFFKGTQLDKRDELKGQLESTKVHPLKTLETMRADRIGLQSMRAQGSQRVILTGGSASDANMKRKSRQLSHPIQVRPSSRTPQIYQIDHGEPKLQGREELILEDDEINQEPGNDTRIPTPSIERNSPERDKEFLGAVVRIVTREISFRDGFLQYLKNYHKVVGLYFRYDDKSSRVARSSYLYISLLGQTSILIFFGRILDLPTIAALSIFQSVFGFIFKRILTCTLESKKKVIYQLGFNLSMFSLLFFYFVIIASLTKFESIEESFIWGMVCILNTCLDLVLYSCGIQLLLLLSLVQLNRFPVFKQLLKLFLLRHEYHYLFGKQQKKPIELAKSII